MIRGLNKLTASPGLGYMMSSFTSHPGGFATAEGDAKEIAAKLTTAGLVVFAPIAYGPGLHVYMDESWNDKDKTKYLISHEFWMPICERFYERCDYGVVAMTDGWHKSEGIAIEMFALARRDVPIHFYDPATERILNLGEMERDYAEEMEELLALAAERGVAPYLAEATGTSSEALAVTLTEIHLQERS